VFQTKFKQKNLLEIIQKKFQGYSGEKLNWLKLLSGFKSQLYQFFPGYSCVVDMVWLRYLSGGMGGLYKPAKMVGEVIPDLILSFNIVLSLLLGLRTNSANDRFWGRPKCGGFFSQPLSSSGNLDNGT